jgi:hypothetical protein
MIVADWKDVGVLVGELVAAEPPFVEICIALAAAFALLMIVEGVRATFFFAGRIEPLPSRPAPLRTVTSAAPHRIVVPAVRKPKLRTHAIKPHRAPRPKIQRSPAHAHDAQPESFAAHELPQVASFEE